MSVLLGDWSLGRFIDLLKVMESMGLTLSCEGSEEEVAGSRASRAKQGRLAAGQQLCAGGVNRRAGGTRLIG